MTIPAHSLNSRFAVAVQASKGTPATTGFVIGRMRESWLQPAYSLLEAGPEHTGQSGTRATRRRAASRRNDYLMEFGGRMYLYPHMIGVLLRGMGFGVNVTDNTTYKSGAFTLADRTAYAWLSVLHRNGDGGDAFERKAKDARLTSLTIEAGRDGCNANFEGLALAEAQSTGTETSENEVNARLSSGAGSFTATIGGAAISSQIRAATLTIDNPLSRDEWSLFSFAHDDLPPEGVEISGTLGGIDVTYDLYKKMNWGGTSGTAPVAVVPEGPVSITLNTPDNIAGAAVPYGITASMADVELTLGNWRPADANLLRADVTWRMIDPGTTPLTITLVNTKATY